MLGSSKKSPRPRPLPRTGKRCTERHFRNSMPTYFGFITIHELLRLSAPAVHPGNKPDRTPVANDSDIVANKLTSKSLTTKKRRERKQKLDEVYLTGLPLTWKTWKSWNLNETSQSQEICLKSQGICNRIPKVQEKSGNFVV